MHRQHYRIHEPECRLRELRAAHGLLDSGRQSPHSSVAFRRTSRTKIRAMLQDGAIQCRMGDGELCTIAVADATKGTQWETAAQGIRAPTHAAVFALLERKFEEFGIKFRERGMDVAGVPRKIVSCMGGPLLIDGRQATLLDALLLPASAFSTPRRRAAAAIAG